MPKKTNFSTALQKFDTFNLVIGKRMAGTGAEHQLEQTSLLQDIESKTGNDDICWAASHPHHAAGMENIYKAQTQFLLMHQSSSKVQTYTVPYIKP